jgi:hypothetical protein
MSGLQNHEDDAGDQRPNYGQQGRIRGGLPSVRYLYAENLYERADYGRQGPTGTGIPGERPYTYTLIKHDLRVCTHEAYFVYSNEVSIAHELFLEAVNDINPLTVSEQDRRSLYEEHWTVFKERKAFLEENIANLDVMDVMA